MRPTLTTKVSSFNIKWEPTEFQVTHKMLNGQKTFTHVSFPEAMKEVAIQNEKLSSVIGVLGLTQVILLLVNIWIVWRVVHL